MKFQQNANKKEIESDVQWRQNKRKQIKSIYFVSMLFFKNNLILHFFK